MEKEMKKLLLIAISVGVFLLVTVTVAIIIMTPKVQQQENAYSSSFPFSQGNFQPASDIMNNIPEQPNIIIQNPVNEAPETPAVFDRNDGDNLTIQIPVPPANPAAESSNVSSNPSSAPAARPAVSAPAPTAVPASTNTAAPAATRTTTAAQTPSNTPAASRTINDYWIQIGAYSAMVRAEDIRENLASKGLVSIIENNMVNGQNVYRVRLGPYTSEREANHWLAIVQAIDGFHDSQVRQTTRQQ